MKTRHFTLLRRVFAACCILMNQSVIRSPSLRLFILCISKIMCFCHNLYRKVYNIFEYFKHIGRLICKTANIKGNMIMKILNKMTCS